MLGPSNLDLLVTRSHTLYVGNLAHTGTLMEVAAAHEPNHGLVVQGYPRVLQKKMAVTILESCMVTPSEETPRHGLWLSNLDLLVARSHTPMVFVYQPSRACFSPDVLKAALDRNINSRREI
ncbi:hypothetical protein EJB05_45931, partial [Eragrostis curvula]